jgi:hypothetical protein
MRNVSLKCNKEFLPRMNTNYHEYYTKKLFSFVFIRVIRGFFFIIYTYMVLDIETYMS